jgi:hypothetical protein
MAILSKKFFNLTFTLIIFAFGGLFSGTAKSLTIQHGLPATCPSGFNLSANLCVKPTICPSGTIATPSGCQNKNGTASSYPASCPGGKVKVGNSCYSTIAGGKADLRSASSPLTCNMGGNRINGMCTKSNITFVAPSCPAGSRLAGMVCVGPAPTCKAGTKLEIDGLCRGPRTVGRGF